MQLCVSMFDSDQLCVHVQVNYDEKGDKGREDGSDYSALSEESGDDSDGKPALKVSYQAAPVLPTHVMS